MKLALGNVVIFMPFRKMHQFMNFLHQFMSFLFSVCGNLYAIQKRKSVVKWIYSEKKLAIGNVNPLYEMNRRIAFAGLYRVLSPLFN